MSQELARAGIMEMDAADEILIGLLAPLQRGVLGGAEGKPESAFSPLVPSMRAKLPDILWPKTTRAGRCWSRRNATGATTCRLG